MKNQNDKARRLLQMMALLLLIGVWLVPASFAQRRGFSPEQAQKRMTENMHDTMKQLELSEEQTPKVQAILELAIADRTKMMEKVMGQGREAMMAMREDVVEREKETVEELSEVLTEEQLEKYIAIEKERAEQARQRRGRN